MNELREHMKYLVRIGDENCTASFRCSACPCPDRFCRNHAKRVAFAKQWLKDHPEMEPHKLPAKMIDELIEYGLNSTFISETMRKIDTTKIVERYDYSITEKE